jgi:hypothetical protein
MSELALISREKGWRLRKADAFESQAAKIAEALVLLDDVHAIAESNRDESWATELRSTMSGMRSHHRDYSEEARILRSDARDEPRPLTPRAITTSGRR